MKEEGDVRDQEQDEEDDHDEDDEEEEGDKDAGITQSTTGKSHQPSSSS